ncbi:MAG: hypothetical protein JXB32_22675 [Deltaproteobacteria bacterium]|nr:hypothetical protein [Deltaproteobacteria bacterium]
MRVTFFSVGVLALALFGCTANDQSASPTGTGTATAATTAGPVAAETAPLTFDRWSVVLVTLSPPGRPQITSSFCRFPTPLVWADRLAASGDCRLLHWGEAQELAGILEPLDVGEITVEVNDVEVPLRPLDPSLSCLREAGLSVPDLRTGDVVRVRSTGGADVPAFDLSLPVPDTAGAATTPPGESLEIGAPWALGWTGTRASDVFVEVRGKLADRDLALSCRGLAGESLTLPAELTALWPAGVERAKIQTGTEVAIDTGGSEPVTLRITAYDDEVGTRVTVGGPTP